MKLLEVERLNRSFGGQVALHDISFNVGKGDRLGIIGRSGAGKSTLLRCLSGLDRPQSGRILLEGEDMAVLPEARLVLLRRRIGLVFQHFNLLTSRTVAANVALPLEIARVPKAQRHKRVAELLDLVGLADHAGKYPAMLSGGQKQRVGIARALAAQPALLLCDEATSALDPETTEAILALLADINRVLGLTIVFITHEMDVVRRLAQQVLVLEKGRIVARGTPADILDANQLDAILPPNLSQTPHDGSHAIVRLTVTAQAMLAPLLQMLEQQCQAKLTLLQTLPAREEEGLVDLVVQMDGLAVSTMNALQAHACAAEVIGYVPAYS
ncbi:methionine ABC transporter ATP-binding protein [Acetobacter syzygii]|uniref:Cell division ATP-binding protein FtsE n=1 Tax=Acetobacter syzygii TaxID=146476 RepID=A0A270B9T6_9PROT|nr:ATP-binding cassette domain-containing protein [Acetobacter syzygii]PAL20946.1 methionine ABC transporter ATP-binding protein [Acetobacter syzygii]PAL23001.1 methionine ABC transporter ATP-binding protein [Acetobacter syzygii]GAN71787.1 ABC transporter D-methionine transport MetN [Acetobacter syzygii]GBR64506.1 D-methionine transporter ATP-binding protein [Acetobacter syzygii NRIC 0483]